MHDFPKNNKSGESKHSHWRRLLIFLFAIIFIVSSYMFMKEMIRSRNEQTAFDELAAVVNAAEKQEEILLQTEPLPEADGTENEIDTPIVERSVLPQYEELYEQNNDLFGWISIEGTKIDYPVMYTPDNPEYYLRKAFDGSYSVSGTLFIDGSCPADGNYYLIYGHHMKNGTMFGQLPQYARQSFFEEHSVIRFDTLYEEREYQVIAAFYSQIYSENENDVFRYYDYTDLTDETVFNEYIMQALKSSIYDCGYDAKYGDSIIALSTCSYHTTNGRFVVVAKQIQ